MSIIEIIFGSKLSDDQVKDLDDKYTGRRHELYSDGKMVSQSDTRNIFQEKKTKILQLQAIASNVILEKAPMFEQMNALAGRLTADEVSKINNVINNVRNRYKLKKQAILDAMTLAELDAIDLEK